MAAPIHPCSTPRKSSPAPTKSFSALAIILANAASSIASPSASASMTPPPNITSPSSSPHGPTAPTAGANELTADFAVSVSMNPADPKSSAPPGMVDLAAERVGGLALIANDEFFAEKENLLKPGRGVFIPDKYTDRG